MFDELIRQKEIAADRGLKYQSVRRLAMQKDWPPVELRVGPCKFYSREAVDFYFKIRKIKPRNGLHK
jgi:hypothetical protein